MIPGDVVTIGPPFGDSTTPYVVSGAVDLGTVMVWDGSSGHSAYAEIYLTKVGEGGAYPAPSLPDTRLSPLAFRQRFTQAEKVAIEIASLDVPSAPMQQRALAAALQANQQYILAAMAIELSHTVTRQWVQALEQCGLITPGRASEILDTPLTDSERAQA